MREQLWQHYEDTPNLILWDVYIWEAHPGDPEPPPKTFAERVGNYEIYKNQKNMTMPCLIDSIGCPMAEGWWASRPTTFYLIGVDHTLVEVYDFMLGSGYYSQSKMYAAIDKALEDVSEDTEAPEVTVTAPTLNENVQPGSTYEIKWDATDNEKVTDIALYFSDDDGSTWELLDSLIPNPENGTFDWDVPNDQSATCKIKVLAQDNGDNQGEGLSPQFGVGMTAINQTPFQSQKSISLIKRGNSFQLYIPNQDMSRVTITDVRGKEIVSFTTSSNTHWYAIPNKLSSGMHIVNIQTPKKSIVKKLRFVQ